MSSVVAMILMRVRSRARPVRSNPPERAEKLVGGPKTGADESISRLADEAVKELCGFPRHCDDEQVAARDHFQPGVGNEPGQDPAVHHRYDWIVAAHHDEGRLPQRVQP